MPRTLARLARTLTTHWKRSMVAALVTLVALGALAGASTKPADSFTIPGAESQKAIDLFRAHTPALAGADSTVVFNVASGKITDPEPRTGDRVRSREGQALPGVISVADPFARGGSVSPDGKLVAADIRYKAEAQDIKPEDGKGWRSREHGGERRGQRPMRGQVVDLAAQQDAPVGELIGVAIAIVLLTLLFRRRAAMVRDAGRRADRRRRRPDPAGRARRARSAFPTSRDDRGDARPRRRHRLRAADRRPLPRAARAPATSAPRRVGQAAATAGHVRRRGRLDRRWSPSPACSSIGIPFIGKMGIGAAIAVAASSSRRSRSCRS